MTAKEKFNRVAAAQRQLPVVDAGAPPGMLELLRAGTLAASSHNTQPWRARLDSDRITILPDFSRRCEVVDPDDSHLHKSLGCMVENIRVAAEAFGMAAHDTFDASSGEIRIGFETGQPAGDADLYRAITERQCTKTPYDGRPLSTAHRHVLETASNGDGVRALFIDDPNHIESIIEFVSRGNVEQLGDAAFRKELTAWLRFNPRTALKTKDGLAGHLAGKPSLPQWLGERLINFVLTPKSQSDTDARDIRSASAVAVVVADSDEPAAWIETGRVYERLALTATTLGVRNAFINQPLEVRDLRPQLNRWLGLDQEQALLMVRLGYGKPAPFSLRRPVQEILLDSA